MRRARRAVVAAAIALLVVGTAATALLDRGDLALGGLAVLGGAVLWFAVEIRFRALDLAHMMRLAAGRQAETQRRVVDLARRLDGVDRSAAELLERLEAAEVRLLGVLEAERLVAADRYHRVVETHERSAAEQAKAAQRTVEQLRKVAINETRNVEALLQLSGRISPRTLLPASGDWALDARSLLHLVELVQQERPRCVLELGSGTSTIWLGYLLAEHGGTLVSVDHDEQWAARTRDAVDRHRLGATVDVRVAPLTPFRESASRVWYDTAAFDDIHGIDLLLVDGPPKATGVRARWPAVPVLFDRLNAGAVVALDDADRPDEADTVARWLKHHDELVLEQEGLSRLAVLRKAPGNREGL